MEDLALSKASIEDDLLAVSEILLRLPLPADLVRAALASKRWLEAASSNKFIKDYRDRHPPPLLGLYVPREFTDGLPTFHLADSVRSDPALSRFARRGDFDLAGLESHPNWSLLDCNGGRLLLSDGDAPEEQLLNEGPADFDDNYASPDWDYTEVDESGHEFNHDGWYD